MEAPTALDRTAVLTGVHILVVEDDTFILLDLESVLLDAGAEIVSTCRSADEAMPLLEAGCIDAAILDFGLGDGTAAALADRLSASGTPFCFYTGQVETDPRLESWRDRKIIQKPAPPQTLVAAIAELLAARS